MSSSLGGAAGGGGGGRGSISYSMSEQELRYIPVRRIFRRVCGYNEYYAQYPLAATGGLRIRRGAVVTCPMLVHEQIALTIFGLTKYERKAHKEAIDEVQDLCPGLPEDYKLVGVTPWKSPYKQPHTFIAWFLNLSVFYFCLLLIFVYIVALGDKLETKLFWEVCGRAR